MIHFEKLPFPPSSNAQYISRGRFRVKSPIRRAFDDDIEAWTWSNRSLFLAASRALKEHPFWCGVFEFAAPRETYLTKVGLPKRFDVDNRIKALDSLWSCLEFDDSKFWEIRAVKKLAPTRYVNISLFPLDIETKPILESP